MFWIAKYNTSKRGWKLKHLSIGKLSATLLVVIKRSLHGLIQVPPCLWKLKHPSTCSSHWQSIHLSIGSPKCPLTSDNQFTPHRLAPVTIKTSLHRLIQVPPYLWQFKHPSICPSQCLTACGNENIPPQVHLSATLLMEIKLFVHRIIPVPPYLWKWNRSSSIWPVQCPLACDNENIPPWAHSGATTLLMEIKPFVHRLITVSPYPWQWKHSPTGSSQWQSKYPSKLFWLIWLSSFLLYHVYPLPLNKLDFSWKYLNVLVLSKLTEACIYFSDLYVHSSTTKYNVYVIREMPTLFIKKIVIKGIYIAYSGTKNARENRRDNK